MLEAWILAVHLWLVQFAGLAPLPEEYSPEADPRYGGQAPIWQPAPPQTIGGLPFSVCGPR